MQIFLVASPRFQGTKLIDGKDSCSDDKKDGEEIVKRRRVSVTPKEENASPPSEDEYFAVLPSLVSLGPGVRITAVAAGGRHTLALSGKLKLVTSLFAMEGVLTFWSHYVVL